jgi:hypothetical protein
VNGVSVPELLYIFLDVADGSAVRSAILEILGTDVATTPLLQSIE